MAPIVAVRIYEEMEVNRANVEQLENFTVINECADKYTNVNTELITSQLNQALEHSQLISLWFWITMGMLIFEVVALICFVLAPLFAECCHHGHNNSDDYRSATTESVVELGHCEPLIEKTSQDPEAAFFKNDGATDPEAAFLKNDGATAEADLPQSYQPVYGAPSGQPLQIPGPGQINYGSPVDFR